MGLTLASLRGDEPKRKPVRVTVADGRLCVLWQDGSETVTNLVHINGTVIVTQTDEEGTCIETFDTVTAEGERTYPR